MRHHCRWLATFSLVLGTMLGVAAQAAAPGTSPAGEIRGGEIRPVLDSHFIALDGRALGMIEAGAEGGLANGISLGAAYRGTGGHGRASTNHYDGHGWQAWGNVRLLRQTDTRPGISLYGEHLADAIHLHSTTSTSDFTADPTCTSTGGQIRVNGNCGKFPWLLKAGVYGTSVNTLPLATVELAGIETSLPVGHHLTLQPSLTGYHDDLNGGRYNAEARLALHGSPAKNMRVTLAGSLFARGIPLAGSPMSVPSAIGVDYGSTATAQLHAQVAGYLSLSADLHF